MLVLLSLLTSVGRVVIAFAFSRVASMEQSIFSAGSDPKVDMNSMPNLEMNEGQ